MFRLKRAMTNADGETKLSGETVSSSWLGPNAEKLVTLGWVEAIKRKAPPTQTTSDKPDKVEDSNNGRP